jgi:hypothetical protein
MKAYKITYWITSGFIALIMLLTSFAYLSKAPQVMDEIKKANFPYYIMLFLGIAKPLGVIALLFSKWPILKEWAYAAFTYVLVGAIWLHISTDTPPAMAIISLIVLAVSYYSWKKLQSKKAELNPR